MSVLGALSGAVGLYWDVSYHISLGRDEGPLANPSHYLIFLGLVAIFAGARSPSRSPGPAPPRTLALTPAGGSRSARRSAPASRCSRCSASSTTCGTGCSARTSRSGARPRADDRQHLMLPYTMLLTCAEARQAGPSRLRPLLEWVAILVLAAGPVAFLLEFAYGVPQFPLVNDPVVLTVATVGTFTLAMFRGARWVVSIWVAHAALQGGLVALNVAVFDALTPWPPSLLGGALVAAVLARRARPTPAYGAVAGGVMTLGMLGVEYLWTQATRPMPWREMMPWAVLFAGLTGMGVGVVATWMHQRLPPPATAPATPTPPRTHVGARRPLALLATVAVLAVFVVNVPAGEPRRGSVDVAVGEVRDGQAHLTVTADPRLVHDAYWFEALSWQGGGVVHGELEPTGPGVWRTDEPMPLAGDWKTLVRLHTAARPRRRPGVPPGRSGHPGRGAPRGQRPPRPGRRAGGAASRERQDVPGWLWGAGYGVVGSLFLALFATVAAGYSFAGRRDGVRLPARLVPSPTARRLPGSARRTETVFACTCGSTAPRTPRSPSCSRTAGPPTTTRGATSCATCGPGSATRCG